MTTPHSIEASELVFVEMKRLAAAATAQDRKADAAALKAMVSGSNAMLANAKGQLEQAKLLNRKTKVAYLMPRGRNET